MKKNIITKKLIYFFIILGVICAPFVTCIVMYFYDDATVTLFLGNYLITIPLGIYSVFRVKRARSKQGLWFIEILDFVFLLIIPGVLIHFANPDLFKHQNYDGDPDYRKALDYSTTVDYKYNEDDNDEEW